MAPGLALAARVAHECARPDTLGESGTSATTQRRSRPSARRGSTPGTTRPTTRYATSHGAGGSVMEHDWRVAQGVVETGVGRRASRHRCPRPPGLTSERPTRRTSMSSRVARATRVSVASGSNWSDCRVEN
jgi:hypothetical protein